MISTKFSTTPLEALSQIQPRPQPATVDPLRAKLFDSMRCAATAAGRSQLLSDAELEYVARHITANAGLEEINVTRLAVNGCLLDRDGWQLVNDRLQANGHPPIPDAVIAGCDPLHYALAMAMPKEAPANLVALARSIRGQTTQSNGTLSLRALHGRSELLGRLETVGWHALVGENTDIVLPLFPDNPQDGRPVPADHPSRNRNGRDAAAIINKIHKFAPDITFNISAGHGAQEVALVEDALEIKGNGPSQAGKKKTEMVQTIDLSELVPPCPQITIRLKESNTDKVRIFAPEGVVIKLVSDLQGTEPIGDVKLFRTTGRRQIEMLRREPLQTEYVQPHVPETAGQKATVEKLTAQAALDCITSVLKNFSTRPLPEQQLFEAQELVAWGPRDVFRLHILLCENGTEDQVHQYLTEIEARLSRLAASEAVPGSLVPPCVNQTTTVKFTPDSPRPYVATMWNHDGSEGATIHASLPLWKLTPEAPI